MFFSATKQNNKWIFESDPGWHRYGDIWAKGYACDCTLEQAAANYDFTQPCMMPGNFCLVKINQSTLQLGHNLHRSFPLWANDECVSNFQPIGEPVWADKLLTVDSTGMQHQQINMPKSLTESLTLDQVTDKILDRVFDHARRFLKHNQLPINIFRSGGLDTTFLYALVTHLGVDFTEPKEPIVESNPWLEQHQLELRPFWGYQQIHHWNTPNILLSGSHGDEYFLRGPNVISMIMAWHDIDFVKILDQNPDAYHHWYFSKPKNLELFVSGFQERSVLKKQYPTWTTLCDQIINILSNDHQHWHLGETLTWTPQKDLDIARWALCLPIEDLIQNSLHGSLTRNCIRRIFPEALDSVTMHKNRPN